jgi:hypothetical protein
LDATRYLNLRFDHVERLRLELVKGPGGRAEAADDGE